MEIKRQYLQKYLHDIAIDQLADDYTARGYEVIKEKPLGNYRADLVAQRGDETIVIEVKTGKMTAERREEIALIANQVKNKPNYKFLVVVAIPPKPKQIDIPNLKKLLLTYLTDNRHKALHTLPEYSRATDVMDIVVDELIVTEESSIIAKGNGTVEISIGFSQSDEDGLLASDVIPFNFDVTLKYDEPNELRLIAVKTLDFDISSFDE